MTINELNLVVFGTSILWGQGLGEPDKIHSRVAAALREQSPGRRVNVIFLAHSGASTGYLSTGSVDTHREPPLHGEVPTLYPTILQEIDAFDELGSPPDSVDVILLDAGINDVHVTRILEPLTQPRDIEKLVELYCHQHMLKLVAEILTKFSCARLVLVGYYEFLTEDSEEGYIHTLARAIGTVPGGAILDAVADAAERLLKRRLLANCDTFAARSWVAREQTAAEMNRQFPCDRVAVAWPVIPTEHAAFTSDPWLYGINDDLSPQDPLAPMRASACYGAGSSRTRVIFYEKVSAGHPNPKGARAYADAILARLSECITS